MPDSLVRLADGLAGQACRERLARLSMGPPGHPGLDGAQVVTATDYRPYGSPGMPGSPDGDRLCAEFTDALFSDEVTKSIQESGPLAILAATDAARRILAGPGNPLGDRLAALAAAIPAEGGEAGPIIDTYLARRRSATRSSPPSWPGRGRRPAFWPGPWICWPATPRSNSGCTPRSTPS
ncbi:hypothetical protein [Streptomyces noursei]|uniref:hypothetical protein n=1 Tax=Streptomyces noursei TaxID=1971 RepID=UPI0030F2FC26